MKPETVRIGPHGYRIRYEDLSERDVFGEFRPAEQAILIDRTLTGSMLADTLAHEILHAIWWHAGLGDKAVEENAVAALATGWCGVLQANPALQPFLAKALTLVS
ncbi:MAG TPA: hypothetical protein VFM97_00220 [Gammaproteobacteria bacterium]|nr:hypothetical protein [Gammaproteobacteria bacterium]